MVKRNKCVQNGEKTSTTYPRVQVLRSEIGDR